MRPTADMSGRRCVITGATSGIGQATALALARAGAELTLVCRSRERGEATRARLGDAAPGCAVDLMIADLASQAEIRRAAAELLADPRPIHVLINNAGVVNLKHSTTVDGIETTFAVNHLAYFLLTRLLLERIRQSPGARIVNVASDAHRFAHLDLDDPGRAKSYRWMTVYGQSKLANILFTRELARRLEPAGVTVNAYHPGAVATGLGSNNGALLQRALLLLTRPFFKTPEQGAETGVYLASSPEVAGTSGEYFAKCRPTPGNRESRDPELAAKLWRLSERMTGLSEWR